MFRFKIYCKSAYLLTCTGVITNSPREPLKKLLLEGNSQSAIYARSLFSYNGLVDTRLEVSFYSTKLKKPEVIIFLCISNI